MINRVIMVGRMTRDAETRTTTGGKDVAQFGIAVQKKFKPTDGSPDADFFNCVAWDHQARFVSEYLGRGRMVAIDGRLQSRKYTASDGSERTVIEIVVADIQSLERPRDDAGGAAEPDYRGNRPGSEPRPGAYTPAQPAMNYNQPAPSADEYDPFADE